MADTNPRILRLLEEVLDSERTPEAVCAQCPELLDELRARLDRHRDVEAHLAAVFPVFDISAARGPVVAPGQHLPAIAGYEIEGVLGRGGMGVVYAARHLRLNRLVALKMLLAGVYAAPREVARFAREAAVVAGLQHEHIIRVYDVSEFDGRPYFTMELIEGGSLAQRLADTRQSPAESAALVEKLARAVQVAHESGIVHRDLKPGNILLCKDGTPKISDFGLARNLGADSSLTWSGAPLGTPSYMAPEQALGHAGAAGPLVDVYALGAILYEMLTGRPPFHAEAATEVARKRMEDEPTAPSRLNAKVPRDLQTICLKCLQFEPQQRYGTPSELADDLRRFSHGEPVAARRAGLIERTVRWGRRRPFEAAVFGGGVLLAFALLSGGVWLHLNRQAMRRTVGDELRDVAHHEAMGEWADARVVLARAKGRLESAGSSALIQRAEQAQNDLDLVARLATILLERAAVVERDYDGQANKGRADQAYGSAFQKAGYGSVGDPPESVGKVVAASTIHDALVGALDDWAVCAPAGARRNWVLATARIADNDKARARLRDPAVWDDRNALSDVTRTAIKCGASVQLLDSLGEQLYTIGGDPIPFLKQVQQAHPENYWANSILADALRRQHSPEAVGYFQAAVAVEPSAAAAYNNLGITLRENGRLQDAGSAFAAALRINPNFAPAHNNLGIVLRERGETDAAIKHFLAALAGAPNDPGIYNNLGIALAAEHRNDEAIVQFRKSLKLNPGDKLVYNNLGISLRDLTRPSEAIEQLEAALRIDPRYRDAHVNIGIAYFMLRRFDQAVAHFRAALEQDDNDCPNHNNLGLALAENGELPAAIREYRRAVAIDPDFAPVRINLAHALHSSGDLDSAIEQLRQASRINPRDGVVRDELARAIAEKRAMSGQPAAPETQR